MKAHQCVFHLSGLIKSKQFTTRGEWRRRWLWPYLLAETVAVSAAVAGITVAGSVTADQFLLVGVSVYSGSVGYYGVIFFHRWLAEQRTQPPSNISTVRYPLLSTARTLILEYGSAELLDSLLFSPLLLYVSLQSLPNRQLAVVLSELASTGAFLYNGASHPRRSQSVGEGYSWKLVRNGG